MRHYFSATVLLTQLLAAPAFALNTAAEALVQFETRANAVALRSDKPVQMPHYEIPIEMLEIDFAERFNPEHKKHLIFEVNGKSYVRWILNPEDTKWNSELAEHYRTKGLILEKKYYFTGYQTASRSYIVEDPKKTIRFSAKSSTNKTGGHWADKPQHVDDAIESRKNADFLHEVQKHLAFEHLVVMDEPAILKSRGADQAVVIRDIGASQDPHSGKTYLPGFSALHEKMGVDIARMNGSKDPYRFWTEHYVKATARAMGELAARTGMQLDSPHSQNFLIELDSNYKPTGKIVIRDMADFYLHKDFMENMSPEHLKGYTEKSIIDRIAGGFGPLHGNTPPSWISEKKYSAWVNVFNAEFEKTFFQKSGLKQSLITKTGAYQSGQYFGNRYIINSVESDTNNRIKQFWHNLKLYKSPRGQLNCSYVFMVK